MGGGGRGKGGEGEGGGGVYETKFETGRKTADLDEPGPMRWQQD